ncbi:hypothetical protein [Enterococcus sp. AZ072]|uniref:hypothetical protein n=1 Tax=unclassified Enterococcus TaxID=2608891 RepID=UPI003D29A248
MVKRTKKEFRDYNDFRDRVFGLKWGTAFAMDDLMKKVHANEDYALKDHAALPEMERAAIDLVLSESFLQTKELLIQLHLRDEFGRLLDPLIGTFQGEAYEDYFVFNDKLIQWEDVRHARLTDNKKWSDIDFFESLKPAASTPETDKIQEVERVKDEFYQPFIEE